MHTLGVIQPLLFLLLTTTQTILQTASGFSLNNNSNNNKNVSPTYNKPTTTTTNTNTNTNTNNSNQYNQRELTESQKETRRSEERLTSRRNTATPGLTSALPGATDFPLTPAQTLDELTESSTNNENEIRIETDRGMEALRMLQLEEADRAFGVVCGLKSDAYCWQRGVVMFYLGRVREACECLVGNARVYEGMFEGMVASEERIWRDACELKLRYIASREEVGATAASVGEGNSESKELQRRIAKSTSIPRFGAQIEPQDATIRETRKVVRIARDLFSASVDGDFVKVALARAKLRSICANNTPAGTSSRMSRIRQADVKMWRLSSWFYLGLHYDVTGDVKSSKVCMKMALHQSGSFGNGKDIIQALPMLHMSRRDWYDDDDFEEDDMGDTSFGQLDYFVGKDSDDDYDDSTDTTTSSSSVPTSTTAMSSMEYLTESIEVGNMADIVQMRSIIDSMDNMRLVDIKDCLRDRDMKTTGSKSALARRLLKSLIREGL